MGIPNIFNTGRSGMVAAKAAIATTGHNISNANTENFSRQRVVTEAEQSRPAVGSHAVIGTGTLVGRVERINDHYIEKQIREGGKDLAHMEEKDLILRQTEDIFNEMNGDGLNRLISKFFNSVRQLSNEPDNEAVRQSVRESSQAMVNDFHRLRKEVDEVQRHIDSRIEGYTQEINSLGEELKEMNMKIRSVTMGGANPNDMQDRRDLILKKLSTYMDLSMHQDKEGNFVAEIKGIGPFVIGPEAQKFHVERSKADERGKPEGAVDIVTTASVPGNVTHRIKGGKLGALLEVRDKTLTTIQSRLDELAYAMSESVNAIHSQGFTRSGVKGINFFKPLEGKERASSFIELSDEVKASVNNIAAAAIPDAPGDNRIAIAISGLQHERLVSDGKTTLDDWYNSIVSDVGVAAARNRNGINQQKDIVTQLGKMRDRISGVSIDEETANLMQFQHVFGASAQVIKVADQMLDTVLSLRR